MPLAPKPLDGILVLDVATMIAGPFCATILGEFGAQVIKIEMPGTGDPLRRYGTISNKGASFSWLSDSRNKKSITLDLHKEKGKEILKKLIAKTDIMIENFRPGTLERWGLGYDDVLKKIKHDLLLIRISAYGQNGPYRDRPGFARLAHGFSGISHLTGTPDGPPLVPGAIALADYLSGLYGAVGALMSFIARSRYGIGQQADVTLYESVLRILDEMIPLYSVEGHIQERMGMEAPKIVPHNHYRAQDGKWVAIACTIDKMFERLAIVMKKPELLNPNKFATMAQRISGREEVNRIVGEWVSSMPRDKIINLCLEGEVPAGPIYNVADIFEDEHYKARETLLNVQDNTLGHITVPNVFPKLSETPGSVDTLGPQLGEHNYEIYRDMLGYSNHEIQLLMDDKVI